MKNKLAILNLNQVPGWEQDKDRSVSKFMDISEDLKGIREIWPRWDEIDAQSLGVS